MNKFADLHLHISLKHYVNKRKDIWDSKRFLKGKDKPIRSTGLNYDQADIETLIDSDVKLALVALHPIEKIVSKSLFNLAIGRFFFGFKQKNIRRLYENNRSYFSVLTHELDYIAKKDGTYQDKLSKNGKEAIIVRKKGDLDNEDITKLIITIEGGHALANSSIYTAQRDFQTFEKDILDNLHKIKTTWPFPVFSLTLSHFTYNFLCGQSWAIPLPGIFRFTNIKALEDLFAKNQLITPAGFKIIEKALKNTEGEYRILIDVKHTHVVTRYLYYEYLKKQNLWGKVPIISSHTGVSGRKDYCDAFFIFPVNKKEDKDEFEKFNVWDINLCDEEIRFIIESKGLIGISLDQRILGAGNNDFKCLIRKTLKQRKIRNWKHWFHTAVFFENIAHIIHVGGKEAWNHVCIGSDFDGIIDPIDSCPTAAYLKVLESELIQNIDKIYLGNDYKKELHLDDTFTISKALRKVFYENQQDFVRKNFPVE